MIVDACVGIIDVLSTDANNVTCKGPLARLLRRRPLQGKPRTRDEQELRKQTSLDDAVCVRKEYNQIGTRSCDSGQLAVGHLAAYNHSRSPVNLAFATLKLRSLCECQAKAEHEFGFAVAKQLRARLADLREVDTVLKLPAGGRGRFLRILMTTTL